MTFRSALVPGVLVGVTAIALWGCSGGGSNGGRSASSNQNQSQGPTGQLAVFAVDAPPLMSALREVRVRIERLEVIGRTTVANVGSGVTFLDTSTTAPITTSSGDGRPISVAMIDSSRDVELLALRNGRREQLAERAVPPGIYTAVRVITSSPSAVFDQSGVPLTFDTLQGDMALISSDVVVPLTAPIVVNRDQQHALLLDFDLARSLAVTQGTPEVPTHLTFTPVIHGRPLEAGLISGVLTSDNFTPGVLTDDVLVNGSLVTLATSQFVILGSTTTDPSGRYAFSSIPPGQYLLLFEQPGHRSLALPITVQRADEQLVADNVLTALVQGAVAGIQTK